MSTLTQRHEPLSRRRRATGPLATLGVGVAAVTYFGLTNPHEGSWIPACPLLSLTGLDCPLCGGSRAIHELTRGDVAQAIDHNLLVVVGAPIVLLAVLAWLWRSLVNPVTPTQAWLTPRRTNLLVLGFVALLLAFAVIRNLPNFSVLGSTLT
ncbi:MAG: DUF2752 domain-containing protein [Actinomycetia bacterium]|nr:DUF2752 domain-containing protein [Actinomycetes bacterium]